MAFININGHKVFFEQKGSGENKLVFVHGNSLSSKLFDEQFNDEKLYDEYELIRFDLPGFGLSGKASDDKIYSFSGFAEILIELYKQLNIQNAILVSNSLGGHVILEALEDLKGIKGIFMNGTPPFGLPPASDMFLPHPAVPLFFKGEHTMEELDALVRAVLHNAGLAEKVKTEILKSDTHFRDVWMSNAQTILPKDELLVVKNAQIPIAVVHGANEKIINGEYIKNIDFFSLWKNEIIEIPEAAHLPFLEQPKIYNKLLLEFCKQVFS